MVRQNQPVRHITTAVRHPRGIKIEPIRQNATKIILRKTARAQTQPVYGAIRMPVPKIITVQKMAAAHSNVRMVENLMVAQHLQPSVINYAPVAILRAVPKIR